MAPARRPTRQDRGTVIHALERYRLRAQNRRLRALARSGTRPSDRILNSALEGIIGLDTDGLITFANPAAAGMIGYTVAELLGQPIQTHMQYSGSSIAALGQESCWREDGTSFPIECETALISVAGRV